MINETINRICQQLPKGFVISLFMEKGVAYVELSNGKNHIPLPDSTDKDILEQLNDALYVAKGWI